MKKTFLIMAILLASDYSDLEERMNAPRVQQDKVIEQQRLEFRQRDNERRLNNLERRQNNLEYLDQYRQNQEFLDKLNNK